MIILILKYFNLGTQLPTLIASGCRGSKYCTLEVYTNIGRKENVKFEINDLETDQWYHVNICQKPNEDNPKEVTFLF